MIPHASATTHAGKWLKNKYMGVEVTGKTLGVIGCGNIGSIVADRANGLKMRVVAYDPFLSPDRAVEMGVEKVELDELLASRDAIADTVELTMRGHCYDALVGLAGCDKSLPGMMMAMLRMNVPSIFVYGGSILPGTFKGQPVTVQDVFEAVGKHSVGAMSDSDLDGLEQVACPSAGACGAQFTANTMATVSEAIGLALPYSAGAPAPYEIRDAFCMTAGEKIMDLIKSSLRPRDIVTREALENAAAVVSATGGSSA